MMKPTDNNYIEFFKTININRPKYIDHITIKYDTLYQLSKISSNYLLFYTYIDYLIEFESNMHQRSPFTNIQFGSLPVQEEMERIQFLIRNREPKRLKILGEVYNFKTCSLEYELEDGTYISKEPPHNTKEELDVNIIPIDFLRIYDNVKFRNDVIENILKDE